MCYPSPSSVMATWTDTVGDCDLTACRKHSIVAASSLSEISQATGFPVMDIPMYCTRCYVHGSI